MLPDKRDPFVPRNIVVSLYKDLRAVYQVEYTVVLMVVTLVFASALGALAVLLWQYHQSLQMMILMPVP